MSSCSTAGSFVAHVGVQQVRAERESQRKPASRSCLPMKSGLVLPNGIDFAESGPGGSDDRWACVLQL